MRASDFHISDSQLARRARDYWYVDGLPTLVGAVLYLVVVGSVLVLLQLIDRASVVKNNWFSEWFVLPVVGFAIMTFPFWGIAILVWLSLNWEDVIQWCKARVTYPRTGYVAPPSYWSEESNSESAPEKRIEEESPLCRSLTILGGFWFWLVAEGAYHSPFWDWRPPRNARILFLCILLAIRALRFGLYPETPRVQDEQDVGSFLRIWRFFRSVLNSFWVWLWLSDLLVPATSVSRRWPPNGFLLCLTALAFYKFGPRNWLQRLGIVLCVVLFYFLLWKNSSVSIALALLLPGIYASCIGGMRLIRYLRTNSLSSL